MFSAALQGAGQALARVLTLAFACGRGRAREFKEACSELVSPTGSAMRQGFLALCLIGRGLCFTRAPLLRTWSAPGDPGTPPLALAPRAFPFSSCARALRPFRSESLQSQRGPSLHVQLMVTGGGDGRKRDRKGKKEEEEEKKGGQGDSLSLGDLGDALRSLASDLEEFYGQDEEIQEERGLEPWQLAREQLLSSRLGGLSLDRTIISADGAVAGTGLFASRDIREGELITCYPGDALVCLMDEEGEVDAEFEYDVCTHDVIFGPHVPDALADAQACFGAWVDYGIQDATEPAHLADTYIVIGIPQLASAAYAGHFCNDGAMLTAASRDAASIARYQRDSKSKQNAMHTDIDGLHMVTIATAHIPRGREVLVTYGVDYWLEHQVRVARGGGLCM